MENILPHSRTNKVLLIYTGGTIGMGCNPRTGALEPLDFNNLVSNLPEMEYLRTGIDVHQFTEPIDSSDVCPRTWAQLVEIISSKYDAYDGFVILHGIGAVVPFGEPHEARHPHRFTATIGTIAHRRQGESRDEH